MVYDSLLDLVVVDAKGTHALKIHAEEKISEIDLRLLTSFKAKFKLKGKCVLLGSSRISEKEERN